MVDNENEPSVYFLKRPQIGTTTLEESSRIFDSVKTVYEYTKSYTYIGYCDSG